MIGIVASVGGFLGIGESYVVLDPALITLADQDGKLKAFVDTSKDDLSKAPKLDYSRYKVICRASFRAGPALFRGRT